MGKDFKDTKTYRNLQEAFAGESMARNKYTYYASQAKKDGFVQISKIFEETAGNEKEHAELWFKAIHGGKIPSTSANLLDAAEGEHYEYSQMYKRMAQEAKAEGFAEIAAKMAGVGEIESHHEQRYRDLLADVKANKVFLRDGVII
jgi:rubrerythrin